MSSAPNIKVNLASGKVSFFARPGAALLDAFVGGEKGQGPEERWERKGGCLVHYDEGKLSNTGRSPAPDVKWDQIEAKIRT